LVTDFGNNIGGADPEMGLSHPEAQFWIRLNSHSNTFREIFAQNSQMDCYRMSFWWKRSTQFHWAILLVDRLRDLAHILSHSSM
jgi:hypothetical protein